MRLAAAAVASTVSRAALTRTYGPSRSIGITTRSWSVELRKRHGIARTDALMDLDKPAAVAGPLPAPANSSAEFEVGDIDGSARRAPTPPLAPVNRRPIIRWFGFAPPCRGANLG